ncbi:MAG: hypothetical protein OHK0022_15050 [Roseiflexaceae bacterium]
MSNEATNTIETTNNDLNAESAASPFDMIKSRILQQIESELQSDDVKLEDQFAWHGSYIKF